MTFDNEKFTLIVRSRRLYAVLILGLCLCAVAAINFLICGKFNVLGIVGFIVVIAIYVFYNYKRIRKNYNYIFVCDEEQKITVHYFHLIMFGKKYNAIEIPFSEFYKYEIVEQQKVKYLELYVRRGNKAGHYPAICLSALDDVEIEKLKQLLDIHVRK